jgi:outer membrane lipoprotein-sorting protein
MHLRLKLVSCLALALAFLPGCIASAATQDDLKSVLARLDSAAAKFQSTQADVEKDAVVTVPMPDTDVQKGVVYYERKGSSVKMGLHVKLHNGNPSGTSYTYIDGVFKLFEPGVNQVTTHAGAAKFESYVNLGFGASGKDLADKWVITYLGSEDISDGNSTVKTAKLQLVAKDPAVLKNVQKVVIWVDPDRAVSLKQVFTLSATSSWTCTYTNFKVNKPLPGDAFTFPTDKKTVYQNQ